MARRRIKADEGKAALAAFAANDPTALPTVCRYLLEELAERAPGNSVEVRVPPYGAVQCIDGPRHTRGTPPNTVEMSPDVWFAVATGRLDWQAALADGKISASGARSDISEYFPLVEL